MLRERTFVPVYMDSSVSFSYVYWHADLASQEQLIKDHWRLRMHK